MKKSVISLLILGSMVLLNPVKVNAEWKQDNEGWRYSENLDWARGWKNISGNWYYFDENGYMVKDSEIQGWKIDSNGIGHIIDDSISETSLGNSGGNISNNGLAVINDNYIYYISRNENSKTTSINRVMTNGIGKETLITKSLSSIGDSFTYLNVIGNYIYYVDFDYNSRIGTIKRMNLDGSNNTTILSASTNATECFNYLTIENGYIYGVYTTFNDTTFNDNTLFRCKLDGTDMKYLLKSQENDHITDLNISGNWIYYTDGFGKINRISKSGGSIQNVLTLDSNSLGSNIVIEDGYLYYREIECLDEGARISINRRNIATGKTEEILSEIAYSYGWESINIDNGWIYYTEYEYNENINQSRESIFKIKVDGSNKQRINSTYVSSQEFINIVGDWIYYEDSQSKETYKVKTNGTQNVKA